MKKSGQERQRAWPWGWAGGELFSISRILDLLTVGRGQLGTWVLAGVPGGTGVPMHPSVPGVG